MRTAALALLLCCILRNVYYMGILHVYYELRESSMAVSWYHKKQPMLACVSVCVCITQGLRSAVRRSA